MHVPLDAWVGRRPWLVRTFYFALGALLMLSFAPFGIYLLAPVLIVPLLFAFHALEPKEAAWVGSSFGAGLFLAGTYWLYVSIHVFGQAPLILALLLMLGLVLIMSFYYAATGWMVARCRGNALWQFVVVAPAVWVLLEWLRGWILTGFPWMTLGYSQIDSYLAGFAPIAGIYGVSFALMLSASALLGSVVASGTARLAYLIVAAMPWLGGIALGQFEFTRAAGAPVATTIVQGGVSQDRKWLSEQFVPTLELYRGALHSSSESTLIIWPEVAIPSVVDQVEPFMAELEETLVERQQTLLFGILERDLDAGTVYNSVVGIDGSQRQIYRKRHLVPFGEFFPVPQFVREWMRLLNLPYSDITPGDPQQALIRMADGNQIAVAICYEDAYAAEQLYALPDATLLVNVSNDAWFGDSIAPHQHLEIARMRALEVGRQVIRATNNGVSAFIDADGKILSAGPQFEFVALQAMVQPRTGLTPFARGGNTPVIVICFLILVWFGRSILRRNSDNQSD